VSREVVYILDYVSWDALVRRGAHHSQDRLALTLMRDRNLERVLLVDPYRSVAATALDVLRRRPPEPLPDLAGRQRTTPLRLRRSDPEDVAQAVRAYRRLDRWLAFRVKRAGLGRPAVITTHPLAAGLPDYGWARSVTFYAIDDWLAHPRRRQWFPAYEASFAQFNATGRRLCAVSQVIVDRMSPTGPALVVPNGVEREEWLADPAALAPDGRDPKGTQLLYAGTLDSRLDIQGLRQLAEAMPEATITLVGLLTEPQVIVPLERHDNIRVLPQVGREAIVGMIRSADVCLIPHVVTPLTEGMSPLKLYEYLAGGRPVVATDLPPMRGVHPRVRLVPAGAELAPAVADVVAAGPLNEAERHAFLERNSWPTRHRQIMDFALA
jgi:glycosyltransferase involved in cell wall biosynthesis